MLSRAINSAEENISSATIELYYELDRNCIVYWTQLINM